MTTEGLALAALAAGFFGSGHCVGMCGAIVMLLEQPASPGGALPRRIAANAGRAAGYMTLGAVGGAAGFVLTRLAGVHAGLLFLRLFASGLVILLALYLLFDLRTLRFVESAGQLLWRRLAPCARHVLPATTLPRAFGAGLLWGALPCGLVYSAVAMAAASGTAVAGAAVMGAFWAGTLPTLLVTGAVAARATRLARRPALRRGGGAVMLVLGIVGLTTALPAPADHESHGGHVGVEQRE